MTQKSSQAKKEHHYVWAYYLRNWSTDRNIWFRSGKGKVVFDSTRMIAKERDFYKVQPLTVEHIDNIKSWSKKSPKHLEENHMSYLSDFVYMQRAEMLYTQSGIYDEEIEKHFEVFNCNGIEDLHTSHENDVKEIIQALAKQDLSALDEDNRKLVFFIYLAHQFTRTKTFRDRVLSAIGKNSAPQFQRINQLTKESWWFMSYMFGMNMGWSFYSTRNSDSHCLLINNTSESFITADQPVVNVHQELTDEVRPPEDHQCDLFYPISPTVAFMINRSNRFKPGLSHVDINIVKEMNSKVARNAHVHIFGKSEESLKPYLKCVGGKLRLVRKQQSNSL